MRLADVRTADSARFCNVSAKNCRDFDAEIGKFDAASAEFRFSKYFRAFSKPAHDETRRAQSRNANLWDAQVAAQHQTRAIGEFWAEN